MRRALAVALTMLVPAAALAQPTPPVTQAPLAPPSEIGSARSAQSPMLGWLPRAAARIEVLDKIDAVYRQFIVRSGQSVQYGSLTIAVRACDIRPAAVPADAAAFLAITDAHPDQPGFQGWMLAQEPWVAMLQSPVYDVRVLGCRP